MAYQNIFKLTVLKMEQLKFAKQLTNLVTKKKSCVPLKQYFFAQYQWMPFFIGSLSLLFYLPYIMFRIVNTDFISLKNDLETPETVRLGFFRRGLTKSPVNIKDGELYNNS